MNNQTNSKKLSTKGVFEKLNNNYKNIISEYRKECITLQLKNSSIYLRISCSIWFLYYLQQRRNLKLFITRDDVLKFISNYNNCSKFTIKDYLNYIKLFLKFLYFHNYINEAVYLTIPNVKTPRQSKIPSVWDTKDIMKMLKAIDRDTAIGKRDYAILLLITKLGLRKIDVICLKFQNINWNNKTINLVQEKTSKFVSLPLLDDVALAIIDYIKYGRPQSDIQNIFITHLNEPKAFSKEHGNFYAILTKYMKKANILISKTKKNGVHSLRHTLASELLKNSTPIETISSILGHVNSNTTSIYLKIDIERLRECTLEVPYL